tara:strand:+ start:358 stop:978 length:621 start_codon:yes stop_codon:yes gene_type:complete
LIHCFIFLLTSLRKDIALGDKLIPIEIMDDFSIYSKGEYFRKPETDFSKENLENKNKEKEIKKEIQGEIIKEEENTNINQVSKMIKEKKILSRNSAINKDIGSEGIVDSNELERGDLKGEGIEKITCLSCLKPKYPKLALKRGYEGILKIKIWISKNGEVTDLKIIKSSGYTILDNSGIYAAKNSRFFPLDKDRIFNLEYNLKLQR